MTSYNLPTSPTASRFGWPKHTREDEFDKLKKTSNLPTHRTEFQGKVEDFPIIRIPIGLPKYRLANGRTTSSQEEYLAKYPDTRRDLFSGDPELLDAQEIQHSLLFDLSKQAGLFEYFKDVNNTDNVSVNLDDIALRIACNVGEVNLSISQLQNLTVGSCINLGNLLPTVKLTANGVSFAEGLLVEVDGRIGVKVINIIKTGLM